MPVTNYVWLGENILYETDENDAVTVEYTYEPQQYGRLLSEYRGSTSYTHYYDALGSTLALTDSTGTVTDTFAYNAWGERVSTSGSVTTPFKWLGENGYYSVTDIRVWIRRRTYVSDLSRWSSPDPKGIDQDRINLFAYVENRPVLLADPSGMDWLDCMAACIRDNDPIDLALTAAIAQLATGYWPKSMFLAIAEGLGETQIANGIRASMRVGSSVTTMPSALSVALRAGGRSSLRVLSRAASRVVGPALTAYGLALAAIETHCLGYCTTCSWYGITYDPANGNILDSIRNTYFR